MGLQFQGHVYNALLTRQRCARRRCLSPAPEVSVPSATNSRKPTLPGGKTFEATGTQRKQPSGFASFRHLWDDREGNFVKKIVVAIVGGTVVCVGIALLVLPGPGIPIVAAGLAILATEFLWAKGAMRSAKGMLSKVRRKSGLREWLRRRGRKPPTTILK